MHRMHAMNEKIPQLLKRRQTWNRLTEMCWWTVPRESRLQNQQVVQHGGITPTMMTWLMSAVSTLASKGRYQKHSTTNVFEIPQGCLTLSTSHLTVWIPSMINHLGGISPHSIEWFCHPKHWYTLHPCWSKTSKGLEWTRSGVGSAWQAPVAEVRVAHS